LRVYGWLESARPRVYVLTDGSGRSTQSRLGSTSKILDRVGASAGRIYGRLTDREIYKAFLNRQSDLFTGLARELAETLIAERIEYVVGDAAEGYNPAHDVCRLIVNAAVTIANKRAEFEIASYDFLLVGPPDDCPEALRGQSVWIGLSEDAFNRKIEVARAYPELEAEVNRALSGDQAELFRVECLRPSGPQIYASDRVDEPPFYERYGEQQVAAGYYDRVVRYREHLLPIAEALDRFVERGR
jgi:hypothetical protein